MTNLTEQWKKGKLPCGWYWVEGSRAEGIYAYTAEYLNNMYRPRNSERIVEQVPSYEEWQEYKNANDSMFDTIKMLNKDNNKLEKENTKLKEQINKCYLDAINRGTANTVKAVKEFGMPERIKELVEENKQLKELLKDCKPYLEYHIIREKHVGFTPQSANVLQKIKQVLADNKIQANTIACNKIQENE